MNIKDAYVGQSVTWAHAEPDGSILYVFAKVIRIGSKKITIAAPLASGGAKNVPVSPKRLSCF
jgi:hypothetical protein